MPVILADRDAQQAWLDPALGAEEALALCGPLPAAAPQRTPANPAVNKAGDLEPRDRSCWSRLPERDY